MAPLRRQHLHPWQLLEIAAAACVVWHGAAGELNAATTDSLDFSQQAQIATRQHVDCGGHYAETCHACPGEFLWARCNGNCMWLSSSNGCVPDTTANRLKLCLMGLWFKVNVASVVIYFALVLIYAIIYKAKVVNVMPQGAIEQREKDFGEWRERTYGPLIVFKKTHTCLWAFFCTPVLAAKNYQIAGVLGYWPSCLALSFTMPCCCVGALVHTLLSQKLKRNLMLEPRFLKDCIISLLCLPCDVGRESLEVDDEVKVEVKCPFKVERMPEEEKEDAADEEEAQEEEELLPPIKEEPAGYCWGRGARSCTGAGDKSGADAEAPPDGEEAPTSSWWWGSGGTQAIGDNEEKAEEEATSTSWWGGKKGETETLAPVEEEEEAAGAEEGKAEAAGAEAGKTEKGGSWLCAGKRTKPEESE